MSHTTNEGKNQPIDHASLYLGGQFFPNLNFGNWCDYEQKSKESLACLSDSRSSQKPPALAVANIPVLQTKKENNPKDSCIHEGGKNFFLAPNGRQQKP